MHVKIQSYRHLMASLTKCLRDGERNLDALVRDARNNLHDENQLTALEIEQLTQSLRRDLQEFARIYDSNHAVPRHTERHHPELHHEKSQTKGVDDESDSIFLRVLKESLWQELADITDKTQLEWQEVLKDVNHHGVYRSGEVVGLGNMVCEKCHFQLAIYTPEELTKCPECGGDTFSRQAFEP